MKRLGLVLLMALWLGGAAHAAQKYELILLDSLDNYARTYATAINNNGEVVGACMDLQGHSRATYWDPHNNYAPVDIGTLGGADTSRALGINDSGDVVGVAYFASGGPKQAFIWNAMTRNIVALQGPPGSMSDQVYSIGDNGQASGHSDLPAGWRACIFELGKPGADISAGYTSEVVGFSDSGWVAGNENSFRTNNVPKAVLGQGTFQEITSLTPGNIYSSARAINKNGVVVGSYDSGGFNDHAFLWDGSLRDLGTLGGTLSNALAINNSRQVVGWSYTTSGLTSAFLHQPGKGMFDLNNLEVAGKPYGYRFLEGHGINNRGEIVGGGNPALAFLLRPQVMDIGSLIMLLLFD
jgi:probable HAF family extracellular repeat protein